MLSKDAIGEPTQKEPQKPKLAIAGCCICWGLGLGRFGLSGILHMEDTSGKIPGRTRSWLGPSRTNFFRFFFFFYTLLSSTCMWQAPQVLWPRLALDSTRVRDSDDVTRKYF